ncbi:MAG: hypothetical protein CYPHOPRED_005646 [Cyphobasidiales sp. Tagirdzhanova-0007]|nr:MAG: hypothetical protein CYPHOPRED_005646 [Cyphobasidiales sp. Tagirdzhanova-0007]
MSLASENSPLIPKGKPGFTTVDEAKLMAKFAIPVIATNMLRQVVLSSSVFAVAKLGTRELAAANLGLLTANIGGYAFVLGLVGAMDTLANQCFLAGLSWTVFDDLGIVFRYGMAGLASTCSEWWAFETVGIGATYLGEASQASTAIYVLSMGVGCNALAGIGVAAAVWIGNLLGQNRPQHAAASAQVVQYLSGTFVTCNAIILISVKNCFGRLFSEDAEVIRLVNRNMYMLAIISVFDGMQAAGTGMLKVPAFSVLPEKLQASTEKVLSEKGYWYAASNAGLGWTDKANREAFYDWRIIPRMLVDTNRRDMTVEIFGQKLKNPFIFAPVGINKIYHPLGELIPARVAGEMEMGYMLSTAASQSIEDVASSNGEGSPRFFQLYMGHDDDVTVSLLERAHKAGFTACILTLDTWQLAWRPTDIDIANYTFYYAGQGAPGNEMGESDPVFIEKHGDELKKDPSVWVDGHVWHGKAHDWNKIPWVRDTWKRISGGRPFALKGIHHAGRQVDGAVASLDQLPAIVDAVGEKLTIIYDSGIRSGSDAFKALALGAKAVLFGRLWIWGMAHGYPGCMHVTKSLLADFDILMTVAGYPTLSDINRKAIQYKGSTATRARL